MDEEELDDEVLAVDDETADDEEEDPLAMGFHEVDAFEPEQDF